MSIRLEHLLPRHKLNKLVINWLEEDTPSFDVGGFIVGDKKEISNLICKQTCHIAGRPFVDEIFQQLSCTCNWQVEEGESVEAFNVVCCVEGAARDILMGERVALNLMSRASGIATLVNKIKKQTKELGWLGELAGTRKTTPGFRLVEKYSLLVGGASTHRYDLSSMVMIKDNHAWSLGGITQAVEIARSVCGFSSKVEVECRTLEEAIEATRVGVDVIMLDNFNHQTLHNTAAEIKSLRREVIIEASGGINESNVHTFCGPNIDVISMSQLTQGYPTIDFSLKIQK